MKHQKQKHFECLLATISMLSDGDYDIVRKYANRIVQIKYGVNYAKFMATNNFMYSNIEKNKIALKITRKFHVTRYIDVNNVSIKNSQLQLLQGTKYDFSGKGSMSLSILNRDGRVIARHIVAFENNMVYDSELNEPLPVEEYFNLPNHRCMKIEKIKDGRTNKEKILDKIIR